MVSSIVMWIDHEVNRLMDCHRSSLPWSTFPQVAMSAFTFLASSMQCHCDDPCVMQDDLGKLEHVGIIHHNPEGSAAFLHRTSGGKLDPGSDGYFTVDFITQPLSPQRAYVLFEGAAEDGNYRYPRERFHPAGHASHAHEPFQVRSQILLIHKILQNLSKRRTSPACNGEPVVGMSALQYWSKYLPLFGIQASLSELLHALICLLENPLFSSKQRQNDLPHIHRYPLAWKPCLLSVAGVKHICQSAVGIT